MKKPQIQNITKKRNYFIGGGIIFLLVLLIILVSTLFEKEEKLVMKRRKQSPMPLPLPKLQRNGSKTTTVPTTNSPYQYDYTNPVWMDACYSTRLVVPTYSGPVLKIEKNDGTQQDLYTDATQSFLRTNTGLSITDWLESGVGKVRVWYDQSGNNNHALCYNYCPTISTLDSDKYVLRFQQYTDDGLQMTDHVKPYSIFFQFWHNNSDPGKIISTDVDPAVDQYYGVVIQNGDINGTQDQYDWYYVGEGDKDFTINQTDSPNYNLGEWNTVCLSIENPDYSSNDKEALSLIGKDMSGYMSELILYNRPMTSDEINEYNNHEFDVKKN